MNRITDLILTLLHPVVFLLLGTQSLPVLTPDSSVAIPLQCTSWQLYLRPYGMEVGFCSEPIEWRSVLRSHTTIGFGRECFPASTAGASGRKFRYV